jgi:thymidylate synthase (FAD)
MARITVPAAEELLDQYLPVLDHGFVRLVDYLGGDQRIVQAARVSYGEGTKTTREDKGLIHYLLRNLHTSPFEQVIMTFHCKLPIFVARQWIRHRTARLNELSGRYSVMRDEFYVPDDTRVQAQSADNKQGSGASLPTDIARRVLKLIADGQERAYRDYKALIDDEVARELARINLPLSLYTEWYWQIDLHNLFHFLRLRLDPHAQYEIREYALAMARCAQAVAPLAYEAFEEYILQGARLSRRELKLVRQLLKQGGINESTDLTEFTKLNKRRLAEFRQKIWGLDGEGTETEITPVDRGAQ